MHREPRNTQTIISKNQVETKDSARVWLLRRGGGVNFQHVQYVMVKFLFKIIDESQVLNAAILWTFQLSVSWLLKYSFLPSLSHNKEFSKCIRSHYQNIIIIPYHICLLSFSLDWQSAVSSYCHINFSNSSKSARNFNTVIWSTRNSSKI